MFFLVLYFIIIFALIFYTNVVLRRTLSDAGAKEEKVDKEISCEKIEKDTINEDIKKVIEEKLNEEIKKITKNNILEDKKNFSKRKNSKLQKFILSNEILNKKYKI